MKVRGDLKIKWILLSSIFKSIEAIILQAENAFLLVIIKIRCLFFLTAGHASDDRYTNEIVRKTTTSGEIYKDMNGKKYTENISQLALANVNLGLQNGHHASYNLMMIHANTQSVGDYQGRNSTFSDDYENLGFTRRQQSNDNILFVNQLITSWNLNKKLRLDVGSSYNIVRGNEPDRRINNLTKSDNGYTLLRGNSQQRYFSALKENNLNIKADLVYRLKGKTDEVSNIRFGYAGNLVDDRFDVKEYNLTAGKVTTFSSLNNFSLDDYYNQKNYASGWFEIQKNVDKYTVKKNIHSVYTEITYEFDSRWSTNAGVKYDNIHINVDYNVNRGGSKGSNKIEKNQFLPVLNVKYSLNDKNVFRLSVSKTYTLPQAKEISPYRYVGVNFNSQGNPDLKPSDNYNIDIKWDFNLSAGELVSLTSFYKLIKNPISRIEVASAGGYLSYENIAKKATVAGFEMEIRKNLFVRPLGRGSDAINKLSIGINGSYIYTNAKIPMATVTTGSQLEGAAPWIANIDVSHVIKDESKSLTNTLVLNCSSDKVYTIGTQGYQNIMEKGFLTLDFVSQAKLNKYISLNLKARNLLNPSYKLVRKANESGQEITLGDYKKGLDISLTEIDNNYKYGGNLANDNSGSLTYVKICYAGARSTADIEHNGLTLNGVGNGTKIENVYVLESADDAIEFFGGTVNVTNLLAVNPDDDMFDFTQGYLGTLKNCYAIWEKDHTSTEADPRGIEADGNLDGLYLDHLRQSDFTIENITIANSAANTTDNVDRMQDVIKIRRSAKATIKNALVKGTGGAIDLIDMNDKKGTGNLNSSVNITNALSLTGKKVYGQLNNFIESTANYGADKSLFTWSGYNFARI